MAREAALGNREQAETLAVIREECSPALSSVNMNIPKSEEEPKECQDCSCLKGYEKLKDNVSPDDVKTLLNEKERQMNKEFEERLEKEVALLKERCQFILQNEQVRASYMLREAHRERQEKITALQTQLECKNLAGLMYVMCSERRKSKLEKLRIIEEYTNYIHALQNILTDAQALILYLSRGYKTAARVDYEWREKMTIVLKEFQAFIHDYVKGTPETEQFLFNVPQLLSTKAPIEDNPQEDPCEDDEELLLEQQEEAEQQEATWYEQLDGDCRPFVMFGDMAEFKPPQRREVLRTVKAAKTAPKRWKHYVFNEMFIRAGCNNADSIKDEYPRRLPEDNWDCQGNGQQDTGSYASRRTTAASIDIRGNMGSILKMITSAIGPPQTRATLLGARDSMEIASTTKLKQKQSDRSKVKINFEEKHTAHSIPGQDAKDKPEVLRPKSCRDDDDDDFSVLGSPTDSIHEQEAHMPDRDQKINFEKICPMEKCQRMQMDSFIRTLPPYMRASPFSYFEQNYEDYETCSPEQLEVLMRRIEDKKCKSKHVIEEHEDPVAEWRDSVSGMGERAGAGGAAGAGVQTSATSLPPCTCGGPAPSPASSCADKIYTVNDLIPVQEALDQIHKECFFDNRILFDRFKVIGQESNDSLNTKVEPKRDRLTEITKVLKQHPSLLDIFQANAI